MKRPSQKERILIRLQLGGWHSKRELEQISGSERIASRINDLKNDGYTIDGSYRPYPNKKRYYGYELIL